MEQRHFAVIGLGYVGFRAAMALSQSNQPVVGYDINEARIEELKKDYDRNLDIPAEQLKGKKILLTTNPDDLKKANFYIITIETPVNEFHIPNMIALKNCCKLLGTYLKKNDVIVFESTVYPGTTEEVLIPLLEKSSHLKSGQDFLVGYSPERIVPGDIHHGLNNTPKIISGQNKKALDEIFAGYKHIVQAKLVPVSTIKVAEAAKVLENIQRDVNIALMNEYAEIMYHMDINMSEVLKAAATKWNFLPFRPGLVGGHCIPVDPYYLIYKAQQVKVNTQLISTARSVNETFLNFIFEIILEKMITKDFNIKNAPIAIFGLSFKKNVADIRNSLSIALYEKLKKIGADVVAYDPIAYITGKNSGLKTTAWTDLKPQRLIIITVNHDEFHQLGLDNISGKLLPDSLLFDIPGMFYDDKLNRADIEYWTL